MKARFPFSKGADIHPPAVDESRGKEWSIPKPSAEVFGLTDEERDWKKTIYAKLVKMLDLSLIGSQSESESREQIQQACERVISEEQAIPLNLRSRQRITKEILDEILGLGPLEPLLADPSVSDILVNGSKKVFVERAGKLYLTDVNFDNDRHLMNILDRIVSSVGRRIDESSPMVDARLKDGSRVNAIIPPLAVDGPSLSIRRFAVDRIDTERLIELGTLSAGMAKVIQAMVLGRKNILISGGTGSGKTTMLNVLSGYIPHDERIVTIEDSAELQLQQPHVVRLESRPSNIEGRGEVTARDLVRNSLRMRPDRIVVGEVRGGEALDMLQAMNTGHDGSLTTIHANTPRDALTRIESMVAMSGINLPQKPLRAQVASAIDLVLQLERMEDGTRRLVGVQEINGLEGDMITMSEIFKFARSGKDEQGRILGKFQATGIVPVFREELLQRGINLELDLFNPNSEV
jgi:pilus assembly protein CpaF